MAMSCDRTRIMMSLPLWWLHAFDAHTVALVRRVGQMIDAVMDTLSGNRT